MSHFMWLKRLLHMTHVFQFSRLFHTQWRNKPAVAIAMLIITAYKRRAADCAKCRWRSDHCGRNVFAIHENVKTDTSVLYTHHRHICACNKNLSIHKALFCRSQTRNCVECDPGLQKTLKCRIWCLAVVCKCDPGDGRNGFCAFHYKPHVHT